VLEQAGPWVQMGGQLVVLGTGEPGMEAGFRHLADWFPGSDLLLVSSRSEPCGLTQMYAMKYGTLPLVRRTGGLADTVIDATPAALGDGAATGFAFMNATAQSWASRCAAPWASSASPSAGRRCGTAP